LPYKRVLTIQDISCVGQCSLTVALPIISACGLETCILPSAVLSTHTGGFKGFTFRDLTDDIPAISAHWSKENITFDAVYTGYLGSIKQIGYIKDIFDANGKPGCVKIVDPAMADNGSLYGLFNNEYAHAMGGLCAKADVILPNITEACFMTDFPYKEDYDEKYVDDLLAALSGIGVKNTVLTGVGFRPGKTGVMVFENGKKQYYEHEKMEKSSHGTGDVYASAFTGALMQGNSMFDAAAIAADFTLEAIKKTQDDDSHWYGVKFELALPGLVGKLNK
jgi:pyridoxine kinase